MENKIDIGQAFREKLNNLDKNPSDLLWEKIEVELNKKKKNRFVFWLFPLLVVLVLSSAGYYFNSGKNVQSINKKSSLILNKNESQFDKTNNIHSVADNSFDKKATKIESKNNNINSETDTKFSNINHIVNTKSTSSIVILSKNRNSKKNQTLKDSVVKKSAKITTESKKTYKKSRKLIRSTTEYDEYEVTKKYRYVVKKKKTNTISTSVASSNIIKKGTEKHKVKNRKDQQYSEKVSENITNQQNIDIVNVLKSTDSVVKTAETKTEIEVKLKNNEVIAPENLNIKDTATIKKEIVKKPKREIKPEDTTKIKKPKIIKNNIFVTPYFGPTYYGSFGNKNLISNNNGTKNGLITYNYGIHFRWMFDEKSGFRIGLGKTDLIYSLQISNNNAFVDSDYVNLTNLTSSQIYNSFSNSSELTFTHKTSHYEIPIEGYFILSNKKIAMAATGGLSVFYLKDNVLTLRSNSVSEFVIGETDQTLQVSYTINAGACFFYKLTKRVNFEISPSLKYQFSEVFHGKGFNPYILSLQTGFSFKLN